MSNDTLRELLHDLADDRPAARVAPDTWRRGRRAHRRGVALTAGALTLATALVSLGGTALVTGADDRPDPAGPGVTRPALPRDLWVVPSRLAPGRDDTGTDAWDPELRSGSNAIGVTAAVTTVDTGRVVAVSAEDGRYRGLDLPGLHTDGAFRYETSGIAALSPDGRRLAYAWFEGPDAPQRSGVRVLDLGTGEVTDHPVPSDLGVHTYGFGWSPSGRHLAYGVSILTSPTGTVTGSRSYRVEVLDTGTGERTRLPFQPGETPLTVDDDGVVATVAGGGTVHDTVSGRSRSLLLQGQDRAALWARDGRSLAVATYDGRVRVVGPGPDAGGRVVPPDQGDPASEVVHLVGWAGPDRLVVGIDNVDTLRVVDLGGDVSGPAVDLPSRPLLTVHGSEDAFLSWDRWSFATDLLDDPTRETEEPDFAGWSVSVFVDARALAGIALLGGVLVVVDVVRRRRRTG